MASKGTSVALYIAAETTPNTLPTSAQWLTVRRTGDDLKKTVSTTESDTIVDTRYDQGAAATSAEAGGTIDFEFTAGGATDLFFEGVGFNAFSAAGLLNIGGDALKTFTIVKHYAKENLIKVFSGCRIANMTISGDTEGKVTAQVTISSTGYSEPTTSPVKTPITTATPFVSSLNIDSFKFDGASTVGVACAQSFEISIENNLTAQRCLGNASLIPNSYTEGKVKIGLKSKVMLTTTTAAWTSKIESRAIMTSEIGITDSKNNKYVFGFTQLELNNDNPNAIAPDADNTLDLEFNHIRAAATITRTLAKT